MEFLGFTLDVATLTDSVLSLLFKILLALLIFTVGRWLAQKATRILHGIMIRSRVDVTAANFLSRMLYGVLIVIVALAALRCSYYFSSGYFGWCSGRYRTGTQRSAVKFCCWYYDCDFSPLR